MSKNLINRVEKAKKLKFNRIGGLKKVAYGTMGSKGDSYQIYLDHSQETICTPDGDKIVPVFLVDCQKTEANRSFENGQWIPSMTCNCPGNERHTICYHGMGAIYHCFKEADKKRLVSFFETYEAASRMKFSDNDYVAKIRSMNGNGVLWCVVKDWPKSKKKDETYPTTQILSVQHNINLMRGAEDDEGID